MALADAEKKYNQQREAILRAAAEATKKLAAPKTSGGEADDPSQPKRDFRLLYYTTRFPEFFDASREKTPAPATLPALPPSASPVDVKAPTPVAGSNQLAVEVVTEKRDVWVPIKGKGYVECGALRPPRHNESRSAGP
jgi:hypothetical protein